MVFEEQTRKGPENAIEAAIIQQYVLYKSGNKFKIGLTEIKQLREIKVDNKCHQTM